MDLTRVSSHEGKRSKMKRQHTRRAVRRVVPCTLLVWAIVGLSASNVATVDAIHWIGTWATAAQPAEPTNAQTFRNQTLRLVVHISTGGKKLRVRLSNAFGEQPLVIGSAHIALRTAAADIDPASDRILLFRGQSSTTVPAGSTAVSDPVDLEAPALSDLAISLFLPDTAVATTSHSLAKQTNYVSAETGDVAGRGELPRVEDDHHVAVPHGCGCRGIASRRGDRGIWIFDHRWRRLHEGCEPALARRPGRAATKEFRRNGRIGRPQRGNHREPPAIRQPSTGGESIRAAARPGRHDALRARRARTTRRQVCLDLPGGQRHPVSRLPVYTANRSRQRPRTSLLAIASSSREPTRKAFASSARRCHPSRARRSSRSGSISRFYTPEREKTRQAVNEWIRHSGQFDGVVDFDAVTRDPTRPTQLLPAYAAGDHLHVKDDGNVAQGNAIPLTLFRSGKSRS